MTYTVFGNLSDNKAEQEVMKVNQAYDQALLKNDAKALSQILADEYIYTSTEGKLINKTQEIEDCTRTISAGL